MAINVLGLALIYCVAFDFTQTANFAAKGKKQNSPLWLVSFAYACPTVPSLLFTHAKHVPMALIKIDVPQALSEKFAHSQT